MESMSIEQKTKLMRKFSKDLGKVVFVVHVKGEVARVRLGKKILVTDCADRVAAEVLADGLNKVIQSNQSKVNTILDILSKKCEQLSLFSKEQIDASSGHGDQPEGCFSDSVGQAEGRPPEPA